MTDPRGATGLLGRLRGWFGGGARGGAGDAADADEMQQAWERGLALHHEGRLEEAESVYRGLLERQPEAAEVLHTLGILRAQRGDLAEAEGLMGRAAALDPGHATARVNRGNLLKALGRPVEALDCYDAAIKLQPQQREALIGRCGILTSLRREQESLAGYESALRALPGDLELLFNLGVALVAFDRLDEAIVAYGQALAIRPDFVEAFNNRGIALWKARRCAEALADYNRALELRPDYAEAYYNRGLVLAHLRQYAEALESYDRAVDIRPEYAEAYCNRGALLADLGQNDAALASYDRALLLKPDFAEVLSNRGGIFRKMGLHERAAEDYERLLRSHPGYEHAIGNRVYSDALVCDWGDRAGSMRRLAESVADGGALPFQAAVLLDDPKLQLQCASTHALRKYAQQAKPLWSGERYGHERIRIAYLSADFHLHATAHLMAELFERHDRDRFEVSAWSFGPETGDAMRARLRRAFGQFHDVRELSDDEVAGRLRAAETDIVVDLKGYTDGCRPGIFSRRPAPIQVNYLGYPGTTGAPWMDYIVADAQVVPEGDERFYSEHVVRLPDSYQVNDSRRETAPRVPGRAEAGLPASGFVYCCFNNNYKITPEVFGVWMRLLGRVEGSVLWLLEDNASASRNLRREAEARGIAAERLIFAPRVLPPEHLARHRLADLFLDTLPCNAHTTASDALWAGLPVLTCLGRSFAGRVAASLLRATGLPELIAEDLEGYEALALRLAAEPALLAGFRARLERSRGLPLFDIERYRMNIESAYLAMVDRQRNGEPPRGFSV